jgi:MFS transporter, FSR family, fosmidomycin resistance protein
MDTTTKPTALSWTALIPLLCFLWVAHFFVDMMLGIWPVYKTLIKLDLAKAGLIVAAGAFIGEGSQLIFGQLSDRGYRQHLIVIGLLATTASTFFVYMGGYMALFSLFLLTCIGSGCFHPSAAGLFSSLVPHRRGLLMTFFASGGSLGLATSQLIYTHTHNFFEGHTFILAFPAVILGVFLIFYRFPNTTVKKESQGLRLLDFVEFFKNPTLRHLYLSQVANQSILWGTIFILPDVLKTLNYENWICYGGGHLCFILGGACMMVPGGYLSDRYSARSVLLIASLVATLMFYFILFTGGISMLVILSCLFVLGASLALVNPIAIALGSKLEPSRPGAISAFLMGLVWCVSEALGPGSVGVMSTLFENYGPVKALAVLGILFILQIYSTVCLPKEVKAEESVMIIS